MVEPITLTMLMYKPFAPILELLSIQLDFPPDSKDIITKVEGG